jgi:glyoxylase-like metal-dependent hydrolase (beta-lactamase superfamily II)
MGSYLQVGSGDVVGLRADNPSPFTLSGTNTWIVGRDPAWLVDPGPELEAHLDAIQAEVARRGGLGGIALTHDHHDHSEALPAVRARNPGVPVAAGRGEADVRLQDGLRFGPLQAVAVPGHAPDHFAFVVDGDLVLTGDAVLGEGSVFIAPDPGALAGYLAALERLRSLRPKVLAPGHGPVVFDAQAKLTEYIDHRRERERRLLVALAEGRRSVQDLLDAAGRLPPGVERPAWPVDWPQV